MLIDPYAAELAVHLNAAIDLSERDSRVSTTDVGRDARTRVDVA
jgi:hypothetical protein